MKKTVLNQNVPYSKRRYSNAAVTGSSPLDHAEIAKATTTLSTMRHKVTIIASPAEWGEVKVAIGGGTGNKTKDPAQPSVERYSRYTASDNSNSYTLPEGQWLELKAVPKSGGRFLEWSDGVLQASRYVKPKADITLTAKFGRAIQATEQYCTLSVKCSPEAGGKVTGVKLQNGSVSVKKGDSVRLTATPKAGYSFVKWQGAPVGSAAERTNPSISFTVSTNCNVLALFEADKPTNEEPPTPGSPSDPFSEAPHEPAAEYPAGSGVFKEEPYKPAAEYPAGGEVIKEEPKGPSGGGGGNTGQGTDTFGQAVAFAKKWWWAILVVIYIIYKEKGGKK